MSRLHGIAGSSGIAIGTIARLPDATAQISQPTDDARDDLQRLLAAQTEVAAQLQRLAAELRAEDKPNEAGIFEAQVLLANDPSLVSEVERLLAQEQIPLPEAVRKASDTMGATLSRIDDPYLRERAADVQAIGQQIIAVLQGVTLDLRVPEGAIVIARDLTPAQTARLRRLRIAGFATAGGTATGHVAILARALDIPAVVGLGDTLLDLPDGATAILDAAEGLLIVEPDAEELEHYSALRTSRQEDAARRQGLLSLPAATRDGQPIELWANIGHPDEVQRALAVGAQGIGLFRTEFLFLERSAPPDEAEQYAAYAAVLREMSGQPVVIRTLDIGGDKPIPYLQTAQEANPFLGWRGIRFAMRFRELFQVQLLALLRAATEGDLRIMLPMVATPADVAWVRAEIDVAIAGLAQASIPHRADVPLGIMIETPAAALTLDLLATGIRFCSIGSNDLAQYTLAADRSVAELVQRYRHDDPAVFRMIQLAVSEARRLGLEISICGELASEPRAAVALVGLGLEKLSMTPAALLAVKESLRAVSSEEARQQARQALGRADLPQRL
ncbi:MAG: phosphoenolpyruvate--protein phosphotransferase [Chloroflexi bacterium]|nr:phosphoenolpyruvate--protein phosphotransferase [Chloroflexota bacterium]